VARICAERLIELRHVAIGAVAHETGQLIALARQHHARGSGKRNAEAVHQTVGEPVADYLHLIDVIVGEWRNEASAEPLFLR
jgi:hypothetical protein